MIVNEEFERIRKKIVVVYIKTLFHDFREGPGKNYGITYHDSRSTGRNSPRTSQ